jgi:3-hydroxybutyryl-CoA dehydratase
MLMEKAYFEDCHVGDTLVTPGRTITEADLVFFAAYTGDWLAPHTDVETAHRSPFGERIAHGMLVLAVGSALLLRLGDFAFLPRSSIAVAEVDKVCFRAPTKIGDTLHFEAEVIRMTELGKTRGLIVIKGVIKNQRGEEVVSFTGKALAGRRPIGDGTLSESGQLT